MFEELGVQKLLEAKPKFVVRPSAYPNIRDVEYTEDGAVVL
jgi:hypothetical protein